MSQLALSAEYRDLTAKVDQAIGSLAGTKLDHLDAASLTGQLARLQKDQLLSRLEWLKATIGLGESAGETPNPAWIRTQLAGTLKELRAFRKNYSLSFAVPKVRPAWQFWK